MFPTVVNEFLRSRRPPGRRPSILQGGRPAAAHCLESPVQIQKAISPQLVGIRENRRTGRAPDQIPLDRHAVHGGKIVSDNPPFQKKSAGSRSQGGRGAGARERPRVSPPVNGRHLHRRRGQIRLLSLVPGQPPAGIQPDTVLSGVISGEGDNALRIGRFRDGRVRGRSEKISIITDKTCDGQPDMEAAVQIPPGETRGSSRSPA